VRVDFPTSNSRISCFLEKGGGVEKGRGRVTWAAFDAWAYYQWLLLPLRKKKRGRGERRDRGSRLWGSSAASKLRGKRKKKEGKTKREGTGGGESEPRISPGFSSQKEEKEKEEVTDVFTL